MAPGVSATSTPDPHAKKKLGSPMNKRQPFSDVAGKVAVITGAARGLGRGAAETLAEHGVHVVVADVLPDVHKTFQTIQAARPDNGGYAQGVDVSDENA